MQNSGIVRGFNSVGDLTQKLDGAFDGQSSLAAQKPVQSFAFDIFHHEIKNAVFGFAEIGYVNNIRMTNRSRRHRFAFKPRNRFAFRPNRRNSKCPAERF